MPRAMARKGPVPRRVGDSRVEMTELVMPQEINPLGSVFGGWVMALMDKAAAMAATRHCRGPVATASVDSIDFLAPMSLGHIVRLSAFLTCAFTTSMEVEVEVHSEDPRTGEHVKTCSAFITMVSLGPDGRPAPAPPLVPSSDGERRRAREAAERRRQRLARRG
ncbi:MAG TPA: acyl-CoA thioesterase [Candidatus Polarisedimenticolia bacterium]|nr:acyl-CoA thioesterase [Candidatus Polarisedimenticolia bacterium]